ncbi:penicillin-binding protein activator [Thiorhodospira sibirica]|uniref:penicillin-binding protein activator n=1 Tax=Thiorhodospira sibirica TaxID=154347 RepID=UPI00022C52B7|nr:penicillin-binding protein activator [Thiorhodospira sibirica]
MKFASQSRYVLCILCIVGLLSACTLPKVPSPAVVDLPREQIEALQARGDRLGAAQAYLDVASRYRPPLRQQLELDAIDVLVYPEITEVTEPWIVRTLADIDVRTLDREARARLLLYRAELALYRGYPEWALQRLPLGLDDVAAPWQLKIGATQIKALKQLHRHVETVAAYQALDRWQPNHEALAQHHQALWTWLQSLDKPTLESAAQQAGSSTAAGWLELALLAHSRPRPSMGEQLIHQWRMRYPAHPAEAEYVALLRKQWAEAPVLVQSVGQNIALLLPVSGRLDAAGNAILEGITAAYYELPEAQRPTLKVYDTAAQGSDIETLYQQAVEEGAGLVIGPLERPAVQWLAEQPGLPVPTLALNRAQDGRAVSNLYQFALNPEEEAIHVAERAAAQGYRNAVALVSQDALGERLLSAFAQRFREQGGRLSAIQQYAPQETDLTGPVVIALGMADSLERYRQLRGSDLQPRADIEMIFVVGGPAQVRLLYPQLRFHRAHHLPVLATSQVYSGIPDSASNADLNGLAFVEIPWLIEELGLRQDLRSGSDFTATAAYNLPRLFALGFDAMRLSGELARLHQQRRPFEGLTGRLQVDLQGVVHRQLSWAKFSGGRVRPIDAPDVEPRLMEDAAGGALEDDTATTPSPD